MIKDSLTKNNETSEAESEIFISIINQKYLFQKMNSIFKGYYNVPTLKKAR